MKKRIWVIIAWLCTVGSSTWASDTTMWHQGQLMLRNGTEFSGELNYNWRAQIVQYRQGITIKAYSANQIQGFAYFDNKLLALRKFVPVDYSLKSGLHRLRILEEVVAGSLLVYREYVPGHELIKVNRSSAYSTDADINNDFNNFSYLVSFNEELLDINVFYRKIWPLIKASFTAEFKQSASLARGEMTGIAGQIRLICWYNGMVEKRLFSPLKPDEVSTGQ